MVGEGREKPKDNDLFFTCALIEYISRKTKNVRSDVVSQLGRDNISKVYDLADVYHCENIDSVSDEFIKTANISSGKFDNVTNCGYSVPSYWDIGKVYRRLIKMVETDERIDVIEALLKVYNSFISLQIDDYNSSVYYENPNYIFECYKEKRML